MRLRNFSFASIEWKALAILIICSFFCASDVYAKEICTFISTTGQVFHLKSNKPPGIPVKVQEKANEGDGVHTKIDSRAHLCLIDKSNLFIAPKSEIILESYIIVPAKNKEIIGSVLIKGLMHVIINLSNQLSQSDPPAFFIKSKYAAGGVRGTDFYVLNGKNFTDFYVKTGKLSVGSIRNPVGRYSLQLFKLEKQAEIRAGGGGVGSAVLNGATSLGHNASVGPQQAVRVVEGMPTSEIVNVPLEYFNRLDKLMVHGLPDVFQEGKDPKQLLELIGSQP